MDGRLLSGRLSPTFVPSAARPTNRSVNTVSNPYPFRAPNRSATYGKRMEGSSTSSASWYSAISRDSGSTASTSQTPGSHQQKQPMATNTVGKTGSNGNSLPPDEREVRVKLSTARSHLSILQTLQQYSEHNQDPSYMVKRVTQQQEAVRRLEQQLRELTVKKKSPTRLEQLKDKLQGRRSQDRAS